MIIKSLLIMLLFHFFFSNFGTNVDNCYYFGLAYEPVTHR